MLSAVVILQLMYRKLDAEPDGFRLLCLLPGPQGSTMNAFLTHMSLKDSDHEYTALSCTMGSAMTSQTMTIQDTRGGNYSLPMTQNLHTALPV